MAQFYTSVQQYGNRLLVREIRNGKKQLNKVDWHLWQYVLCLSIHYRKL